MSHVHKSGDQEQAGWVGRVPPGIKEFLNLYTIPGYEVLLIRVWGGGLLLVYVLLGHSLKASPWLWSPNQLGLVVSRQGLPHLFPFYPNTHTHTQENALSALSHGS